MRFKKLFRMLPVLCFLIALLLRGIFPHKPAWVEILYSNFIYRLLSQYISLISSLFPFSLAEVLFLVFILFTFIAVARLFLKLLHNKNSRMNLLKKFIYVTFNFCSLLYFLFLLLWGINYYRLPVDRLFSLNPAPSNVTVLEKLCKDIILRANTLRSNLPEDSKGIMEVSSGYQNVFNRAYHGFEVLGRKHKEFRSTYRKPKPVLLSVPMSYAQIWGMYTFFTAEVNMNTLIPAPFLASTTCHEIAHQYGFAREEEANFLAYVACKFHPDPDFQYSGILLALTHSTNKLYEFNQVRYRDVMKNLTGSVQRDLSTLDEFDRIYNGEVGRIADKVNDLYLKANGQKDGSNSYGRVVDLLIAEYQNRYPII